MLAAWWYCEIVVSRSSVSIALSWSLGVQQGTDSGDYRQEPTSASSAHYRSKFEDGEVDLTQRYSGSRISILNEFCLSLLEDWPAASK